MSFIPEHPFKHYSKGYEVFNKSIGRYQVSLYNNKDDYKTILRSRYNMCVSLGYEISSDMEVDHINENKLDDSVCNLQLLTGNENLKKHYDLKRNGQPMVEEYTCAECKNIFKEDHGIANQRKKQSSSGDLFCSMECSIKSRAKINTLTIEQQDEIKQMRLKGMTIGEIKDKTGYCPATVMKYQPEGFKFAKISEEKINKIKDLLVKGHSINFISKELRADKATIRKFK